MFYLVRHGEPDYSNNGSSIFKCHGMNFAPLTPKGIEQLKETAKDKRLHDADIIISSPYTRTMQSAAILSKELQIDMIVEPYIFEWYGDKNGDYQTDEQHAQYLREYGENNGVYPDGEDRQWESKELLRQRLLTSLEKYTHYNKAIVVCHGMLISSVYDDHSVAQGEIVEFSL